jgi:hypothetical protein
MRRLLLRIVPMFVVHAARRRRCSCPPGPGTGSSGAKAPTQPLSSRFAALRVRPAARDHKLVAPHPVEWLVVEWPQSEAEPTKYWLSTLPEDMPLAAVVDVIKAALAHRMRLQELKRELGLAHFEGRGWRDSIITPASASQLRIPGSLRDQLPPQRAGAAKDPTVLDPHAPPIRPEPGSIATSA